MSAQVREKQKEVYKSTKATQYILIKLRNGDDEDGGNGNKEVKSLRFSDTRLRENKYKNEMPAVVKVLFCETQNTSKGYPYLYITIK